MENLERVRNGGSASPSPPGWGLVLAGADGARFRARSRPLAGDGHYVSDDEAFAAHVKAAFEIVLSRPDLLVLLGVAPDADEAPTLRETAFHGILEARSGLAPSQPRGASPHRSGHAPSPVRLSL